MDLFQFSLFCNPRAPVEVEPEEEEEEEELIIDELVLPQSSLSKIRSSFNAFVPLNEELRLAKKAWPFIESLSPTSSSTSSSQPPTPLASPTEASPTAKDGKVFDSDKEQGLSWIILTTVLLAFISLPSLWTLSAMQGNHVSQDVFFETYHSKALANRGSFAMTLVSEQDFSNESVATEEMKPLEEIVNLDTEDDSKSQSAERVLQSKQKFGRFLDKEFSAFFQKQRKPKLAVYDVQKEFNNIAKTTEADGSDLIEKATIESVKPRRRQLKFFKRFVKRGIRLRKAVVMMSVAIAPPMLVYFLFRIIPLQVKVAGLMALGLGAYFRN